MAGVYEARLRDGIGLFTTSLRASEIEVLIKLSECHNLDFSILNPAFDTGQVRAAGAAAAGSGCRCSETECRAQSAKKASPETEDDAHRRQKARHEIEDGANRA